MGVRKEIIASKSKATLTFLHNSYGDPDHVPEPWEKSGFQNSGWGGVPRAGVPVYPILG